MDALKAARELRDAGIEESQAKAIARVINDYGRQDLVTEDYLDMRLRRHTAGLFVIIVAINIVMAVGFRLL